MSIQYEEAVAMLPLCELPSYIHTPHAPTHSPKHMHTQLHTTDINKGEENKNFKPTTWNFVPSLHTLVFDGTGSGEPEKREKGKQEDRTLEVAGIH